MPVACATPTRVPLRAFRFAGGPPGSPRGSSKRHAGHVRDKMVPHRSPDIEADVWLLPTEEGGKTKPALSGYRPQHLIMEDYQTSGEHQYPDSGQINPGGKGIANIWFISPEVYPKTLWVGREIEVREGSWLVGWARVTKVFNPDLESETKEIRKWDGKNGLELHFKREMIRFGYTRQWFDSSLISKDAFFKQVDQRKKDGDNNFKHYRYAAFNSWIKENEGANDKAVHDYISIALQDPDPMMAGGALANLMDSGWITDAQFETITAEFPKFGKWTERRIERAKLRRKADKQKTP